ncbi:MAG: hypothetical protein M5R36_28625 [Deltaproteobacteria bacterium]|nr:hypothetical protein [Deltaproteobacteria bacterium]
MFYQKDDPELDMDVETPAYVTSWNQSTDDPEAPQQPESIGAWPLIYIDRDDPANNIYINWLFDAWPGRHTWLPSSVFQKHCRTYVDPDKYRYLKMLAFLRHVVAPEKVIYGEMLRPPLVNDQTTNILSYKYFWPINKLVEAHRLNESGVSPPQDPIDICISNTI